MDIVQTIYWSKPNFRLDTGSISQEVRDILNAARRKNPVLDITGAFVFTNNMFVQVLEGPEYNVMKTMGTIARDERHRDVQVLTSRERQNRDFPDWAMAFAPDTEANRRVVMEHCGGKAFDPRTLPPEKIIGLIKALVASNAAFSVKPDFAA